MTAAGSYKIKRGTWNEGEDAYKDVAHAIAYLSSNSKLGRYALVLSPELYLDLQRLQPNVGLLELDRISKELEKNRKFLGSLEAKLGNEKFVSRAPEAVVNAEKEKAQKTRDLIASLEQSEAALKSL